VTKTKAGIAIANHDGSATLVSKSHRPGRSEWAAIVPDNEWAVYLRAIKAVRPLGWPFMLGGAFGLACHTGRWRNTKDLDFFILADHREGFIDAITKAGFMDYYDTLPYDRSWIYRGCSNGTIVDLIWDTPNHRCHVDLNWVANALHVELRGESLLAVPPEEILFIKSFVMQKDRCDWTDLLNLLCFQAGHLDWAHVLDRFGSEQPILRGILNIFAWLCPVEASQIPAEIRERLGIEVSMPENPAESTRARVAMLDSRPWFAAFEPVDAPMKI
jgi:hypothetical protein